MKKFLLMTTLCLLLSSQAFAINCEGGKTFKANDGRDFCVSNVSMSWFSAFAWCDSHGLRLATVNDCDLKDKKWYKGDVCFNFNGTKVPVYWAWTSTNSDETPNALYMNFSGGYRVDPRNKNAGVSALCVAP